MRAEEQSLNLAQTHKILEELSLALDDGNCIDIQEILLSANTGYTGSNEVSDLVWKKYIGNFSEDSTEEAGQKGNIAYIAR